MIKSMIIVVITIVVLVTVIVLVITCILIVVRKTEARAAEKAIAKDRTEENVDAQAI